MKRPLVLVSAAALIDSNLNVLIGQRPSHKTMAGLWEFPGGKIEDGETLEGSIIRELHEELGVLVDREALIPFSFASHSYEDFDLLMPLFLCRRWRGTPQALEHSAIDWVPPERLDEYEMPPADAPLVSALQRLLLGRPH